MQLKLSQNELSRLNGRVEEDYNAAIGDHQARMERFVRYYRSWRNRATPPPAGEEDASNFTTPLIQWQVYQKWARDIEALFGGDAEIVAKATGPSDQKIVAKVGRYMSWRLFQAMRIVNPLAVFDFRKILFGRAHAYRPWVRETYPVLDEDGRVADEVDYEGPGFFPLWPDDLIVPAEDADTIHDFSFVLRRYRTTPDDLLRGDGTLYQGIAERFGDLVEFAKDRRSREDEQVKSEKDEAEGVIYDGAMSSGNAIVVHEWYGKWRMLRGKADGREDNLERRYRLTSDLVVRRIPELNMVVGVQDLMTLYPQMRRRRPFSESSLTKDGSYWCMGLGELLESIQDEMSANHNLFTDAGQLSVGPVIFAKPGAGIADDKFRYEPFTVVTTEDPAGVNVVRMQADLNYPLVKEQALGAIAERVTGLSDLALGRQSDRPNAPRTASGTIAILESGNIRVSLDTRMFREDMGLIAHDLWTLETQFAPPAVFFRVTEEDAGGLFETAGGGSKMTSEERGGRYDFDIKFATSVFSKEARKDRQLQLYGLDIQNPLIAQNPRALWMITNAVHKALGDDNFADLVPEPPDLGAPKRPSEEWTLALQGEDFQAHPNDNDDLHLIDHYKRLNDAKSDPKRDEDAVRRMVGHVIEHQKQKGTKVMMQALTDQLAKSLATNTAESGGLMAGGVPASFEQVQNVIGAMGKPG